MYRPLPDGLTIKKSPIEGLGLYATKDIKSNVFIGLTHILDERFENNYLRTPLGAFYNHSDTPNCTKSMARITNAADLSTRTDYKIWRLFTLDDIKKGEELTLTYTFYKIKRQNRPNSIIKIMFYKR